MLRSIDLKLREKLKDKEFRRQWFRAQLEAHVPDMFRALREDRSLTQQELASLADMKQSAISRFEKSDEANWKFETLLTLAEALDAKLEITLVKAEDVIANYERREGGFPPKSSVLGAAGTSSQIMHNSAAHRFWVDSSSAINATAERTGLAGLSVDRKSRPSGITSKKHGAKAWN